jgi:hypothetical protein
MKTANPIEKLARDYFSQRNAGSRTTAELDEKILASVLAAQERSATRLNKRRVFGNPIFRWAAVPSLAAIVLLAFLLVPHLTTRAWAIDQTIQALRAVKGIYLSGWCVYPGQPKRDFEIWARPSAKDPAVSGDFKLREGDTHLAIASELENATCVVEMRPPDQGGTVVYLTEGLNRRTPLQTDRWFERLKQEAKNWTEELRDDPQTGRRIAVVTCEGPSLNNARFWEFEFDVETKLPVRARVWFKPDRQGDPHFDIAHFAYNPVLPEDTFDVTAPAGAQVVDCRAFRQMLKPEMGLPVGQAALQPACRLVVEDYWKAVIGQDWDRARQLRPAADERVWAELRALYQEDQPVELSGIPFMEHLSDPGTFAEVTCQLKLKDGQTVQSILDVDVARFGEEATAVIAGSLGPEFIAWPVK